MPQFATTLEGDQYFKDRLHTIAWDEATEADRNKALREASMRIDRLNFRQDVRDLLDLGTPPTEIKNATIEFALSLLDGTNPEVEHRNLSVVAEGLTGVRTTYDRSSVPEHLAAGIPSLMSWAWLKPLLARYRDVRLSRVS